MGYSIEHKQDAPIIVVTFSEDFSAARHLPRVIEEVRDILDNSSEPVHYITDTRAASVSFTDVVPALAKLTRGASGIFAHPHIQRLYFVVHNELIQFAVKALSQAQYGRRQAVTVDSVEAALALIERDLAASAPA